MKVKILIVINLFFVAFLMLPFKANADERRLIISIDQNGEHYDGLELKAKHLIVSYDESSEMFTIKDSEKNELFSDTLQMNSNYHIKMQSPGVIYYELLYDSPYNVTNRLSYNGLIEIKIENKIYYIYIDGKEVASDAVGMTFKMRWGVKLANKTSDVVINNVESPYEKDEILAMFDVFVYDEHDGDISDKVVVEKDNYTANKGTVGVFSIDLSVVNLSDKMTEHKIYVVNHYYGKPTITGKQNLVFEYSDEINLNVILEDYKVSDKHDESPSLSISKGNLKEGIVGNYEINVSSTNKTLGTTVYPISVVIQDTTAPTFTDAHSGIIQYSFKNVPSASDLLIDLTANDGYDGDLTSKIKVVGTIPGQKIGTYVVTYQVQDKAGNKATHTRTYQSISDYEPIFYVSSSLLTIEDVNALSPEQLAAAVLGIHNINYKSYEILEDTYTINANKAGNYYVTYSVIDEFDQEHIITHHIRVFSRSEEKAGNKFIIIGSLVIGAASILGIHLFVSKKLNR